MINNFIPIIVLGYFLYYLINSRLNNILTGLIFVSFFIFATNYTNYGLDFDIFRYLHRFIGILVVIALIFHIFRNKVNVFKELMPRILTLFFLVLLLSFIGNDIYAPHYILYVRNFIFISSIVIYLFYMLDSKEKLEELMSLIVAITLIFACFIVLDFIQLGEGEKAMLFYSNQHYLAYSLLPGFTFIVFSKKSYIKWFFASLVIFAIFATTSKAAVLSSIFIISSYVYSKLEKKIYLIPIFIGFISMLVLFINQAAPIKNYPDLRYAIPKIVLNIIQERPINGIGYGQFRTNWLNHLDLEILLMNNYELNDKFFDKYSNSPLPKLMSIGKFEKIYVEAVPERLSEKDKKYIMNFAEKEQMTHNDLLTIAAALKELGLNRHSEITKEYIVNFAEKEQMTHNDLLTVVAELGLLGLAFLVFLFYKLYLELRRLLLHDHRYFYLSISLIGGSLIFSQFHNNLTSFVFWFVIFIPFIMNRNYEKTA